MFKRLHHSWTRSRWPGTLALASALLLAACGGGGGGSTPPEPPIAIVDPDTQCAQWLPWSAASTWGGSKPTADSSVVIPSSQCIELNEDPPALASLTIYGALRFADTANRHLQAGWILVEGGALQIGSAGAAFQHEAQITLNATNMDEHVMPGMGTRGLFVNHGRLLLYGKSPSPAWTQINAHAPAGTTTLSLKQAVNWQAGDQVVIAPTDFYGIALTETRTVASLSNGGTSLGITAGLTAARWGQLQYVDPSSPSGLSLTAPTPLYTHTHTALVSPVLDQRAEVGNLRRSIIIQGANDAHWTTNRFGGQTMFMGLDSTIVIDGVLLRRMGQNGKAGRYPAHWHMNSYGENGAELGDANANGRMHVMRNSVVSDSAHRCITLHGTNGLLIQNNICHNIRGHAIFIEDAVERRNVIEDNLILHVRQPLTAVQKHDQLNPPDGSGGGRSGASGFWITNPDNIIRRNVVADAVGSGFWYAIPNAPIGHPYSKAVDIHPRHMHFGSFEDNVAHSIFNGGLLFDLVPKDEFGTVGESIYQPTLDGASGWTDGPNGNAIKTFTLARLTTYKNRDGFWNRLNGGIFDGFISADNTGKFFAGSSAVSDLRNSLAIGASLNDANTWLHLRDSGIASSPYGVFRGHRPVYPPMAFASYHGGVAIYNNTVVNMPHIDDPRAQAAATQPPSGAFATDDFYLRPIERSFEQNLNNHLIHSIPGVRSTPTLSSFVFAGAVKDIQGLWGAAGNYWVYNQPFFTEGGGCNAVGIAGGGNASSCNGEFFGAEGFVLNQATDPFLPYMPLQVSRRDPAAADNVIGSWSVSGGTPGATLANMRHFAMRAGGAYALSFPDATVTNVVDVRMVISNMHSTNHEVVLAVQYDSSAVPTVYATKQPTVATNMDGGSTGISNSASTQIYTQANNRIDLLTGAAQRFWFDDDANLVWVKLRGGLDDPAPNSSNPFSDKNLYAPFWLRIRQ